MGKYTSTKSLRLVAHKMIMLDQKEIPYTLIISGKARRLSLKIGQQSGLEVVVPRRMPLYGVPRFIHEKQDWILKHLTEIEKKRREARRNAFKDGAVLNILGTKKTVRILYTNKLNHSVKEARILKYRSNSAYYDGYEILVFLSRHKGPFITKKAELEEAKEAVKKYLKRKAKQYFEKRVAIWAERMCLEYKRIAIKSHKARWGSCSRDKNLNFNWRLIFMPTRVIDSIIIHELAHLRHLNHSRNFYALVEEYCPDHRELSKELVNVQFPI